MTEYMRVASQGGTALDRGNRASFETVTGPLKPSVIGHPTVDTRSLRPFIPSPKRPVTLPRQ